MLILCSLICWNLWGYYLLFNNQFFSAINKTLYQELFFSMLMFKSISNVYLVDIDFSVLVCKNWYRYLNLENNDVWRMHCIRKLADEALRSELLSSVPTYKAKLRAFYHAWNPNDCSKNIYVKPNGFTLHRNPVAQSTDGARGKIGFRSGRHAWEVIWEGPLGTVAVIGIATKVISIVLGKERRNRNSQTIRIEKAWIKLNIFYNKKFVLVE